MALYLKEVKECDFRWGVALYLKAKIAEQRVLSLSHGMADGDDSATTSSGAGRKWAVKRSRRNLSVVDDPKGLATMFASMVTAPASEDEWIARNGDMSLFKVLEQMMPEVS